MEAHDPSWAHVLESERAELSRSERSAEETAGLALSGSGLRSATFALGVLDGLKRAGLLKKLDYLSTVSGGSHIGAWLMVNTVRAAEHGKDWLAPDADWSPSIRLLRSAVSDSSESDRWSTVAASVFTTLIATVTVILGLASLLLLVPVAFFGFLNWPNAGQWRWIGVGLPILAVVSGAANVLRDSVAYSGARARISTTIAGILLAIAWAIGAGTSFDPFHAGTLDYGAAFPIATLILVAGFLLLPVATHLFATIARYRDVPARVNLTSGLVQAVVVVPLMATAYLVTATLWSSAGPEYPLSAVDSFGVLFTTEWRYLPLSAAVFMSSLWLIAFCSTRRRNARSAVAVMTAGVLTTFVLYVVFCAVILWLNYLRTDLPRGAMHAFVLGPPLVALGFSVAVTFLIGIIGRESTSGVRDWWYRMSTWLAVYAAGWVAIAASAVYVPEITFEWLNHRFWATSTAVVGAVASVAIGLAAAKQYGLREGSVLKALAERVALIAPAAYFGVLTVGVSTLLAGILATDKDKNLPLYYARAMDGGAGVFLVPTIMLGLCVALMVIFATRFDVNEFSLNAAYRDRLVRRYLSATRFRSGERQPQSFTGVDDRDDLRLAELARAAPAQRLPILLINCSVDASRAGGATSTFVMSPRYCGSTQVVALDQDQREMGFVPTSSYGGASEAPTVGQAMCVSGAAETPYAGHHRYLPVAVLMALFNQRLGWWLPNPLAKRVERGSPTFGMASMLGELFGAATLGGRFIRVSDGGRFEILGLYELVRRQCRVIIVSDAESDPALTFGGLVRAIRKCEDDFGVKIDLDLTLVRPDGNSPNRQPFTVGTITYPNGQGWIIYLKAIMTGREDTVLRQYHAGNPTFPHESLRDHFASSEQFDSYYRLGQYVARRAFARVVDRAESASSWSLVQLASKLATGKNGVPRIFISYRREDSGGYVNHLYEHLSERFGHDNVFRDLSSIATGADFVEQLRGSLKSCDATLVVIGRSWLTMTGADGQRRLSQANDFVRLEVAESLKRDILVCPLLVGGARMPDANELPGDLAPLATRQAFAVVDVSFAESVDRLMETLAQA